MTLINYSTEQPEFFAHDALPDEGSALWVDLANDIDPELLAPNFARIVGIRVHFPKFSDGRAFSQARRLRRLGYLGIIRASGHLIPDQRPLAERCGINEFALDAALIERTLQTAWQQITPSQNYLQRFM